MRLRQIPHLVKKDLRDVRWLFVASLLLVIVDLLLRLIDSGGVSIAVPRAGISGVRGLFAPLALIIAVLVIARIVQADPVCGESRAFWLTRPISRSTLFVSKLTSVMLVLVVPGLFAIAAFLAAWHVPAADMLNPVADALLSSGAYIAVLFTAAALTPRLAYMLLLLAGAMVGGIYIWAFGELAAEALPLRAGQTEEDVRSFILVPIAMLLTTLVMSTVAAWWTYRTRSYRGAAVILSVLAATLSLLPPVLVVSFADLIPTEGPVREPWAASDQVAARIPLDKVHAATVTLTEADGPGLSGLGVEFEAPLILDGLPEGYVASVWLEDISWRVSRREVGDSFGYGFSRRRHGQWESFTSTDRDWVVPASDSLVNGNWLVFLRLPAETYRRDRDKVGHYSATAIFDVYRYEPLGSHPLRAGASIGVDSSERFEIVSAQDTDEACAFELRHSALDRIFERPKDVVLGYRVENVSGRRFHPDVVRTRHWSDTPSMPVMPSLLAIPLGMQDESLIVSDQKTSCAELRLSGVRVSHVGTVTRRIDLPNLVLSDLERARP